MANDDLYAALKNADAAGDTEGARKIASYIQSRGESEPKIDQLSQAKDIVGGLVKGASRIGSTLLAPVDYAARKLEKFATGVEPDAMDRGKLIDEFMNDRGVQKDSLAYKTGQLGSEIAGTAGAGTVLGLGAKALGATRLGEALTSGGSVLNAPAKGFTGAAGDVGTRIAGGTIGGAAQAGLVNPDDAAIGAAIGGALPLPLQLASRVGQKLFGSATNAAGRTANEVAGEQRPEILALLDKARNGDTAAQAAVDAESPMFTSLGTVMGRDYRSAQTEAIKRAQEQVLLAPIENMAGNPARYAAGKQWLQDVTDPMRESALSRANRGKEILGRQGYASQLEAQAAEESKRARQFAYAGDRAENMGTEFGRRNPATALGTPTGMPSAGKQYSYGEELAKRSDDVVDKATGNARKLNAGAQAQKDAADAILASGSRPLDVSGIRGHISNILTEPGQRTRPFNRQVLGEVQNVLDYAEKANGGIVDVRDLYSIRKDGINDIIEALQSGGKISTKANTSKLTAEVRQTLDDAIEAAGGNTGEWKSYLNTYKNMSGNLEEMKLGKTLLEAFKSPTGKVREGSFATAVRKAENEPNKFTGEKTIDSASFKNRGAIQAIENEIERNARLSELSNAGSNQLSMLLGSRFAPAVLPNIMNAKAHVANSLFSKVSNYAKSKSNNELARLMENPRELADAMRSYSAAEQNRIAALMASRYGANLYGGSE